MKNNNTNQIRDNLAINVTRLLSALLWTDKNFQTRLNTVKYGLDHGMIKQFLEYIDVIIKPHKKENIWKLYTLVFVEGVRNLLKTYGDKNDLFNKPRLHCSLTPAMGYIEPPKENLFKTFDYAKKAIERLEKYGKTNIRFSLIEDYGEERVSRDLRKVCPNATLFVDYASHEPDQLRDYLYDGSGTKMTVMYPIMPIVYITLVE